MAPQTPESLLIRGGHVLSPGEQVDRDADVLLRDGRVDRIEAGIAGAARVIDARGKLVIPGLVDLHVHLREPGQLHKEEIATGTLAAAAGGFTTVCCMPNTSPTNDSAEVTEAIVARAEALGGVRVRPIGAITRALRGEELSDFDALKRAGAVALSDDGRCVMNASLMRRALERARELDLPIVQHCEDHDLSAGGAMNEGAVAARLGISAQPPEAESVIVARDLELCALTGARYHVAHVSTAAAIWQLRAARARGLLSSCEATPHHLLLTDEACENADPATKVNPPLRSAADREVLLEALSDGIVDAIATDHAPHAEADKALDYERAAFGISGIETALALCLDLWRSQVVSLGRLVALLTCGPARLFGLAAGGLAPGDAADVAVVDLDREWVIEPARFHSRGHNTPFGGRRVRGAVVCTVARGKVAYEA
jgi:dihydroorotase